jgi:hypothetical protein
MTYQSDLKFLMLGAVATPAADVAGLVLPGGPTAAGAAPGCNDCRRSSKACQCPPTSVVDFVGGCEELFGQGGDEFTVAAGGNGYITEAGKQLAAPISAVSGQGGLHTGGDGGLARDGLRRARRCSDDLGNGQRDAHRAPPAVIRE